MARKKKNQEEEELLAPDPFLESGQAKMAWLEKNLKLVIGAIVLVLVAVLAFELTTSSSARSASVVTDDLTAAVDEYREATGLQKVLTSTSPASLKSGYQKAYDAFQKVRADHAKTGAARLATVYHADLARRLDKYDEAVTMYDEYISGAKADDPLLFFALEGAGYALEAAGKNDEALARFEALAEKQPFYADYALKHQARILEKKGDSAGALAAYKKITEMEPASPLESFAEKRIRALE